MKQSRKIMYTFYKKKNRLPLIKCTCFTSSSPSSFYRNFYTLCVPISESFLLHFLLFGIFYIKNQKAETVIYKQCQLPFSFTSYQFSSIDLCYHFIFKSRWNNTDCISGVFLKMRTRSMLSFDTNYVTLVWHFNRKN